MTPDWAACCHLANDFKTLDRFFKILLRSTLRVIFYKQELNCCPACRTSSASKEVHKHFWTSAHFPFLLINLINIASVGANNIFNVVKSFVQQQTTRTASLETSWVRRQHVSRHEKAEIFVASNDFEISSFPFKLTLKKKRWWNKR